MKRTRWRWWAGFATGVVAVAAALGWVTCVVLELEAMQAVTLRRMRHTDTIGGALWRMDTWLARYLATEAARSPGDYRAVIESQTGGTPAPSPLMTFRSPFIRLHLEVPIQPSGKGDDWGLGVCSPQAPRDDCGITPLPIPMEQLDRNFVELERVESVLGANPALAQVIAAEDRMQRAPEETVPVAAPKKGGDDAEARSLESQKVGYSKRAQFTARNLNNEVWNAPDSKGGESPVIGPLVPIWVASASSGTQQDELFYLRRVRANGTEVLQGFVVDWPALRASLLSEITDLLPSAALEPVFGDVEVAAARGNVMASLPALLKAPLPAAEATGVLTPARLALLVTWIAALLALTTATFTLRASRSFAEKRSRFASAVTHELRTPLTTFRMYSEMLADGMITDPERQQLYLNTIKDESARLAALVENVLAYARIEEGRQPTRRTELAVGDLLDRVMPLVERRAAESGVTLRVERAAEAGTARVFVDPDAVGQVLYNLVDNACKYGCPRGNESVTIEARVGAGRVELRVNDPGPGIPAAAARHLFTPFDRCGRESSATPGVGLGLALSRELARAMGGELRLEPSRAGACFVVTLPLLG